MSLSFIYLGTAGPRKALPKMHLSRAPAPTHTRAPTISMYRMTSKLQAQNHAFPGGRRIQVRKSGVHGKGVFAARAIAKGEVLIEYVGERITWPQALDRHPHDPSQPDHTFYFSLDAGDVIDANVGGNAARWINHACTTNCIPDEIDGRVFIRAKKAIKEGDELFYDYGLVIDERYTPALKKRFECRCGTRGCRGTMLSPKR